MTSPASLEGKPAPEFSLPDQDGKMHALADYRRQWVVLYFYPKDDTPGCTTQACAIRDSLPDFGKLSAVVLGTSADSVESHKKFAEKYALPFTLLADEKKEVVNAYGVWGPKKMMGLEVIKGILRTSFLISPEGVIAKVYESVKPAEHAPMLLADLEALRARSRP